jgi:hypothetical protein
VEASRDLKPILLVGAPLRFEGKVVQLRAGHLSRSSTRNHTQNIFAQLPRVLRKAPVHFGASRR